MKIATPAMPRAATAKRTRITRRDAPKIAISAPLCEAATTVRAAPLVGTKSRRLLFLPLRPRGSISGGTGRRRAAMRRSAVETDRGSPLSCRLAAATGGTEPPIPRRLIEKGEKRDAKKAHFRQQ